MKRIKINSPEFKRILKNMQFENIYLSQSLQRKALEIVNSNQLITQDIIKEAIANDKVQ